MTNFDSVICWAQALSRLVTLLFPTPPLPKESCRLAAPPARRDPKRSWDGYGGTPLQGALKWGGREVLSPKRKGARFVAWVFGPNMATKSAFQDSPSVVPVTKSALPGPPSALPATKFAL